MNVDDLHFFVIPSILLFVAILLVLVISQRKQIRTLQSEVATDPLTGLLNRRAFLRAFGRLIELLPVTGDNRHRSLGSLAVFFIDLDHFKRINDTYGHAVGDEVLQAVAKIIQSTLRESDLVCRWGGEEMIAVLPGVQSREAVFVAEKVRLAVSATTFSTQGLRVTTSIGVTSTTEREDFESLIARADEAVYAAKNGGRNQIRIR